MLAAEAGAGTRLSRGRGGGIFAFADGRKRGVRLVKGGASGSGVEVLTVLKGGCSRPSLHRLLSPHFRKALFSSHGGLNRLVGF